MTSKDTFSRWTIDLEAWLIPFLEATEVVGKDRVKRLLKFVDKSTSGGQAILATVSRVLGLDRAGCLALFTDATEKANADRLTNDVHLRWHTIKHELRLLRPNVNALAPETELQAMKRLSTNENLLEFVMRFRGMAEPYIKDGRVTTGRALQILYQKLPADLQRLMTMMKFQTTDLSMVEDVVRNKLDWMCISTPGLYQPTELHDYMDIDGIRRVCGEEEASNVHLIHTNGRVDFASIKTINDFKEAMRVLSYRNDIRALCRELSETRTEQRNDRGSYGRWPSRPGRNTWATRSTTQRVFNVDEALLEDEEHHKPEEVYRVEMTRFGPNKPAVAAQAHDNLMHCDLKLNGHRIQALVDTGAAVSVIALKTCVRYGFPVDESRSVVLSGFNEARSTTKGCATLRVQVGDTSFAHDFHVVNFGSVHKCIMGNDLLKSQGFVPDPANEQLRISEQCYVPCHVVKMPPSTEPTLTVKRTLQQAKLPTRGSDGSAGYDLYSAVAMTIPSGQRRLIATGIKMKLPPGCYGRIAGRSGLALRSSIDVAAGVIDADYEGDVGVILCNNGSEDFSISVGMRIAQLICEACTTPALCEDQGLYSDSGEGTRRADGGYGSTGLHNVQTSPTSQVLAQEPRSRHLPVRQGDLIQLPCIRSFYLKPAESKFLYLPFKASKALVLHPAVHSAYRVETGFVQAGQYFRLKITNLCDCMMHVTEKSILCCLVAAPNEQWTVEKGIEPHPLSMSFLV